MRQHVFEDLYRSTNIDEIRGKEYDLVVCAGAPAVKWRANKFPREDRAAIDRLLNSLSSVQASKMVLISTVDVYPGAGEMDESFDCGSGANHAYGAHRLLLEKTLGTLFTEVHTIRLPGVFGPGLKKNVIYDLLHDNCLTTINPESFFQYYDVSCLWADIKTVLSHDIRLINFATEPIATRTIVDAYFPGKCIGTDAGAPAYYNICTRHAAVFGKQGKYRFDAAEVLGSLGAYIGDVRLSETS